MADMTTPQMPMGSAARLPLTASDLMPAIRGPAPAGATPPPQAAGLMAGPGGTPLGGFPSPSDPADAPYDIVKQPDGSAVWMSKTDPPFAIAVVPAPKLPVSLQPPKA